MYTNHKSNSSCSCKSSLRTGKHRAHTHTRIIYIYTYKYVILDTYMTYIHSIVGVVFPSFFPATGRRSSAAEEGESLLPPWRGLTSPRPLAGRGI